MDRGPSPAVYPFSIRPLMLNPTRAQQPHVRPSKNPAGPDFGPSAGYLPGSNFASLVVFKCTSSFANELVRMHMY